LDGPVVDERRDAAREPGPRALEEDDEREEPVLGARGVTTFIDDGPIEQGFLGIIVLNFHLGLVAYLFFYSALDSRLARALRSWWIRAPVMAGALASFVYVLAHPDLLGGLSILSFRAWAAFGLLGLLVAISAWREAPRDSMRRRQAKAYALAFGVRDAGWFLYIWWLYPTFGPLERVDPFWTGFFIVFAPCITIAFVVLLGYGILRTQLLDIDLHIKIGLRRSTVAAMFVAVFFVVSELAASLLTQRMGAVLGVAAAGLLVFALAPLQRLSERVADAAMPGVRDTREYRTVRKREVYRAAVEAAHADGAVSAKERDVLAALADQLGLTAREALEEERAAGVVA
ncbi:MAG TPA: hypothetical protein VM582_05820, partial [Candidatus Thermoplasmatota archaeon]|nr:hypothetical protein [Candidatus Thermoplasmatota archaeon]